MTQSIAEAILDATKVLRNANVVEARREAGSLLANVLGHDRTFLITHATDLVSAKELDDFHQSIARRAKGEPLQYITGSQEFFGLDFEVNADVLIPRPETELLVETALEIIDRSPAAEPRSHDIKTRNSKLETRNFILCDIGTGSGCIAIALLHERSQAHAVAVDISAAAVQVASRNAARHNVSERISFIVADSFAAFRKSTPRFDLIVSNPPYISDGDLADLQREVRDYEPRLALTSGSDGLSMIRRLLAAAPAFLVEGGHLIVEIGYGQRAAIEELIDASVWKIVSIREDLQRIPRTVTLQKQNN
jgi:release factor glutamine methyltransferase